MHERYLAELPLLDEEALVELKDIMSDDFSVLAKHFLHDLPVQIAHLRSALDSGSAHDLYQIAHKLASGCGNLGAMRLAGQVRQLEQASRQNLLEGVAEMLEETGTVAHETTVLLRAHLRALSSL